MRIFNLLKALIKKVLLIEKSINYIADYIEEEGTDGIWRFEKWNSGKYVCYLIDVLNLNSGALSGGVYGYEGLVVISAPIALLNPVEVFDVSAYRGSGTGVVTRTYKTVSNHIIQFYVAGNQNTTTVVVTSLYIIGKWK